MNMPPLLSVVVPFYNVENYFAECLASLAAQTLEDVEFILVDDGSPDGSGVIAKSYVERDSRFRLVEQENRGLGPARNTGAAHAAGKYLAFADSDDVLPRHAYELLVGSLEESGSDLACGGVRRLGSGGTSHSAAHIDSFVKTVKKTHVSELPTLFQDRTAWNKVFRRSFWDTHAFRFPSGMYEDHPVTVRAHVLASAVDVLKDVVYYWRVRAAGERSITQRRRELANICDRLVSVRDVSAFLAESAPQLKRHYDEVIASSDLPALAEALDAVAEADEAELVRLAVDCVNDLDPAALAKLPVIKRLKAHLMRRGLVAELREVLRFEGGEIRDAEVVRRGLFRHRWYARYPYFGDARTGVPDEVFELGDELALRAKVDEARWHDGRLRIAGHALIKHLDVASPAQSEIRMWLVHAKNGTRIPLTVRRVQRIDVTADSGRSSACYDWTGFAVEVDPAVLGTQRAVWELHVTVASHGVRRSGRVAGLGTASGREIAEGVLAHPIDDGGFAIKVSVPPAVVTECAVLGGELLLRGRAGEEVGALTATRRQGVTRVVGSASSEREGRFLARLPLEELIAGPDPGDLAAAQIKDGVDWDLSIEAPEATFRLSVLGDLPSVRYVKDGREVAVVRTRHGNLAAIERVSRPLVDRIDWFEGDRLVLTGEYGGRPDSLTLRHRRSVEEHTFPVTWEGDRFTVVLTPAAVGDPLGDLPLRSGTWDLLVRGDSGETAVSVARSAVERLPRPHVTGVHEVSVRAQQGDTLGLRVRPALRPDERGRYAEVRLRSTARHHRSPRAELAVFDGYGGRQYACNPRAISEELARRGGVECVWVTADGQFRVPDGVRTVLQGSREHEQALGVARFVVGNRTAPRWYTKRPGQMYLQTWHGTPLKRLGRDLARMPYRRVELLDWLEYDVPKWDLLISPSPFATPIFRRAFGYEGEILESGYPRNDALLAPRADAVAAAVRRRLGIPEGKRVILYAPTWRDDHQVNHGTRLFTLELDLERAHAALGEDHVILLRTHYLVTDRSALARYAIDVAGYPDIADLYLIADVLVTDYSSAMFDFAVTGRPMVFFTYDLARYRDEVRGFCLDLESEAPGPLLTTSDEVIAALRSLDPAAYAGRYARFTGKYCPFDDGKASARVVDRLLES
ncbi:bifunctional glycosyltransferase/CDP-glycerol:glycerophosphate glycerophosphotransferase [Rhizohabitans arisaemae]|uniref:bifunctional glycosyltransferase/CDP-glycerol:glycerophosphate glycerophosphotransferase n=1 Tax=Rhizohabitans arisaemae TaxID=2720610 RepID=UPI0024B06FEF|nr:bifunctional glycosyltransferase/CDP-glycerol:glycerophosphate glycerophosphotransferase [Rhizohabitans arisaemae]